MFCCGCSMHLRMGSTQDLTPESLLSCSKRNMSPSPSVPRGLFQTLSIPTHNLTQKLDKCHSKGLTWLNQLDFFVTDQKECQTHFSTTEPHSASGPAIHSVDQQLGLHFSLLGLSLIPNMFCWFFLEFLDYTHSIISTATTLV